MLSKIRDAARAMQTPRKLWLALTISAALGIGTADVLGQIIPPPQPQRSPSAPATPASQPDKAAQSQLAAKQLRLAIAQCWTIDASAASDAAAKTVQIEFVVKRSGELAGVPRIVNRRGQPTPVTLAQSAVRAIQTCAPYTNLPAEAFDKGTLPVRMTFDARGL
jgi:hypothetical protein